MLETRIQKKNYKNKNQTKKCRSNGPSTKLYTNEGNQNKNVKTNKALKKSIKRACLIIWLPVRNECSKYAIIWPTFGIDQI